VADFASNYYGYRHHEMSGWGLVANTALDFVGAAIGFNGGTFAKGLVGRAVSFGVSAASAAHSGRSLGRDWREGRRHAVHHRWHAWRPAGHWGHRYTYRRHSYRHYSYHRYHRHSYRHYSGHYRRRWG
jgi:hypothetical protein